MSGCVMDDGIAGGFPREVVLLLGHRWGKLRRGGEGERGGGRLAGWAGGWGGKQCLVM